jgi:ATP-dependent exoDNAse (exonuclease V) alpha subunit
MDIQLPEIFMGYKSSTATSQEERPQPSPANPSSSENQFSGYEEEFGTELVMQVRRIVEDAVRSVTRQRAYFREADLIRAAVRIAEKEIQVTVLENSRFTEMVEVMVRSRELVELGATGYLSTPEMLEMEAVVLSLAGEETTAHMLNEDIVQAAINRKTGISEEQIDAVRAACLMNKRVTVIEGAAGAGKTFTTEAIKESYQAHGYDVLGVAISWSAAKVLGASAGLDNCRAMEGLTKEMIAARQTGTEFFRGPTLVIVDEAGMVGTRYMSILLSETNRSRYPIKVVLSGDSLQVNPVDAGNALQTIIAFHGTAKIRTIRRQKQPSHRNAIVHLSERQAGLGLYPFVQQEAIHFCPRKGDMFNAVARDYVSFRLAHPGKEALVLAHSNKDVSELNRRIRLAYRKMGLIEAREIEVDVTDGKDSWKSRFSVGDEVVVRSNDKDLRVYQIDPKLSPVDEKNWNLQSVGVFNRNSGRIIGMRRAVSPPGSYDLIVDLGGDRPGRVILNTHSFRHPEKRGLPVVHNFATTIYASQGQTVDQVFLCDDPMLDFRLAYVGMSRHRWDVQVYLNEEELHRRKDRTMGKSHSLQARKLSDASGQPIEDLEIEVGRYTRSEMLQTVAMTWSRDASNMTATLFERTRRTKIEGAADEKRAMVRPLIASSDYADFLPEQFELSPTVDIVKILDLPDPIVESVLVPVDDMDKNRLAAPAQHVPLRPRYSGIDVSAPGQSAHRKDTKDGGIFSKTLGWMLGHGAHKPEVKKPRVSPVREMPTIMPKVIMDPGFDEDRSWIERILSRLARRPTVPVPFLPMPELMGQVTFETVMVDAPAEAVTVAAPSTQPTAADTTATGPSVASTPIAPPQVEVTRVKSFTFPGPPEPSRDPSQELLQQTHKIYWAAGRNGEPRLLARTSTGVVTARYRLDGQCVVGDGQPVIWGNPKATASTPIYLVQTAKEWFRLHELAANRYSETPEKVPHLVWCAKDMDLALLAKDLRERELCIAWRQDVSGQEDWAANLQKRLWDTFGLRAAAVPPLPGAAAAPSVSGHPQSPAAVLPEVNVPHVRAPSAAINISPLQALEQLASEQLAQSVTSPQVSPSPSSPGVSRFRRK